MMSDTQMTKQQEDHVPDSFEQKSESISVPDVDIIESSECFRLLVDMPGTDQASVEVSVENNILSIDGLAGVEAPEGYELVGREYNVGRYRRDFTLSDTIDSASIKAKVRDGVLELTLPKREEVKTRKIAIES